MITGLKTGGKYRFRVIAFNAAGNGEPGEVPEVLEVNDRIGKSVCKFSQNSPSNDLKDLYGVLLE